MSYEEVNIFEKWNVFLIETELKAKKKEFHYRRFWATFHQMTRKLDFSNDKPTTIDSLLHMPTKITPLHYSIPR